MSMRTDNRVIRAFRRLLILAATAGMMFSLAACAPRDGAYCDKVGNTGYDKDNHQLVCKDEGHHPPRWSQP